MDDNQFEIADLSLADAGAKRIDWARAHMGITRSLAAELAESRPFDGLTIGICLHVEAKTAIWLEALIAGGATIHITGSPGSTQDDTAAALVRDYGVHVYTRADESYEDHLRHCRTILAAKPDLIADNGADLHALIYADDAFRPLTSSLIGATEETTTGAFRLRNDIPSHDFPTLVINDTQAKRIVENRFGVGSSVVDGIMRATNVMLHGKNVVVIGYGYCGSGVAQRFRGMGAHVTVVDPAPLTRLEAHMEGFRTAELEDCLGEAEMIVTVTGHDHILRAEHFPQMRSGVILANAGHFATEIDVAGLREQSSASRDIRDGITEYTLEGSKTLFLLHDANLINLAAGDGNPIEIMDLGLALQTLSLKYLVERKSELTAGPQTVPYEVEDYVARRAVDHWVRKQE